MPIKAQPFYRRRPTLALGLCLAYLAGGGVCHFVRCARLRWISYVAVDIGSSRLPSARDAVSTARQFLDANRESDPYLTIVSCDSDGESLTIRLVERLPYTMMLLTGEFASGNIVVTAEARRTTRKQQPLKI